jgi:hypothetical protein
MAPDSIKSSLHFNNLVVWSSPYVGQLQTKPWTNAHSFRILRGPALLALLSFRAIVYYGTTQIISPSLSPSRREELPFVLGPDFPWTFSIGRVQNQ